MKSFLTTISLFSILCASARASEEWNSMSFDRQTERAEKIFVGKFSASRVKENAKILSFEVIENLRGTEPGQIVEILCFEGLAHFGDPTPWGEGKEILCYLRACPNKPAFAGFCAGLFLPASGDGSMLLLEGEDAAEIRDIARRAVTNTASSVGEIETQLNSNSPRVRAHAMATLESLPSHQLYSQTPRLLQLVENNSQFRAQALSLLAKAENPQSLDGLVPFALNNEDAGEYLPLIAHTMSRIDTNVALRKIQEVPESNSPTHTRRALALLGELNTPESIEELLRRKRISNGQAHSNLQLQSESFSPLSQLVHGSLEEQKAAAYFIIHWGNAREKELFQNWKASEKDKSLSRFLNRLEKNPHLSLVELNRD